MSGDRQIINYDVSHPDYGLFLKYCFNNPTAVGNDKEKMTFNHNDTQIIGGNGSNGGVLDI